jgi:hypothetical protein
VEDASAIDWIDFARQVALFNERVHESCHALFGDCKAKREIRLNRVAVPEILQDPILGERHRSFFEREFREARESRDGVTDGRLLDGVGRLTGAKTINPCWRHGPKRSRGDRDIRR